MKYILHSSQYTDLILEVEGAKIFFHSFITESKDLPQKRYTVIVDRLDFEKFLETYKSI